MQIGWIGQEQLACFGSLLLPDVRAGLERGEPITALGLTDADRACGAAAAWLREEGVMEICSLYVAPDYRRRGGGRLLLDTLYRLGQGRCQALAIRYTCTQPDHETLSPFLSAVGFVPERGSSDLYQIGVGELARAPFFLRTPAGEGSAKSFAQVPPDSLAAAYKKAAAQGENYLDCPLTHPSVDAQVSVALMEGDTVRSFAVFTPTGPGRVRLAWVKSGQPQDLPLLLHTAFVRLREQYPPETVLTIQTVTDASQELVANLIPEARPISFGFVRSVAEGAAQ